MEIDVVCGMRVDPAKAAGSTEYEGKTYYFCSKSCLQRFEADPTKYLDPAYRPGLHAMHAAAAPLTLVKHRPTAPGASLTPIDRGGGSSDPPDEREYTCPMHPEVRQRGPGSCPICGMALEPVEVSLEEEPNHELHDMSRRFWWSLALTAPILAFMVSEFLPIWIELVLATPVVLWGGWPFFVRGWASIVSRHLNMFTLIALGVGAAYLFSVVATIAPGLFPESFRVHGQVGVYFEPAAVIVVLVLLGQVLELRARSRTSSAIRGLLGLAPKTARQVEADGTEHDMPLEHVHVGDRLRVRPGERVPVDGVVIDGATSSRRVDGDGRTDPGRESARCRRHRRHRERHRDHRHGGPSRRQRHAARADRADGQRGAALARADSAPGRYRVGVVRAGRDRGRPS